MSSLSWITVEDAVVAALESQLRPAVKTVLSYQGNWRTDLRQETWRLPAALVMLRRSRSDQVGLSSYDLTLDFEVLGLEVTPLALVREEPLLNDGEFTVYAAHYRTALVQDR